MCAVSKKTYPSDNINSSPLPSWEKIGTKEMVIGFTRKCVFISNFFSIDLNRFEGSNPVPINMWFGVAPYSFFTDGIMMIPLCGKNHSDCTLWDIE